jgi:ssDNA-binding Zn-finger/Zn-ribbon topoisomerase 1
MQKNIVLIACLAIFSIIFSACSNNTTSKAALPDSSATTKDTSKIKQTAAVYTCKMHPEVTSDKPGKCPKCGMDLVKKETMPKDSTMQGMKMDSTK